jgi:hypothetical protein
MPGGNARPSDLAVFALITSWNFVAGDGPYLCKSCAPKRLTNCPFRTYLRGAGCWRPFVPEAGSLSPEEVARPHRFGNARRLHGVFNSTRLSGSVADAGERLPEAQDDQTSAEDDCARCRAIQFGL